VTHYRTATIDGTSIFYREAGPSNGPVVVLLHGFPTSSHMFRNLILALADHYHVILVANSGAEPDQATICRAANCEMRVFAEGVSLCHSATLTRFTATAVMTCCKRVFANPM